MREGNQGQHNAQLSKAEVDRLVKNAAKKRFDAAGFFDLIANGDVRDSEVVLALYKGSVTQAPISTSPIDYALDFLEQDGFKKMDPESQRAFVKGVSKVFLGGYQRGFGRRVLDDGMGKPSQTWDALLANAEFRTPETIHSFLRTALTCTDWNVTDAAKLVQDGATMDGQIPLFTGRKNAFYHYYTNSRMKDKFEVASSRLAFRAYTMLGGLNPGTQRFVSLLLYDFEKAHNVIKTEIMRYIAEILERDEVSPNRLAIIRKFLIKNESLYHMAKQNIPDSPFVASYEQAKSFTENDNPPHRQESDGKIN